MYSKLLPDVVQRTFSNVSSLKSLDYLLKTSPKALNHFSEHGTDIFEHVLCSQQAPIHEHTRALIRIAALVRSSSLPPQVRDWYSFRDLVRHESTSHRYDPPAWTLPPTRLSRAVSASTLLGILATQQRIECLVTGCLEFYLKRFRALQPRHPAEPSFEFKCGSLYSDGLSIGPWPWEQRPAGRPFPVHDVGPPTWLEEQRVLRAFWRLQLFQDLKAAAAAGSLLGWSNTDRLQRATAVMDLHDPVECPEESSDWDFRELEIDEDREPDPFQQDSLLEHELVWSAVDYTKKNAQAIAAPDFQQTKRNWPLPLATNKEQKDLSDYNSDTHAYFYRITGTFNGHNFSDISPLQNISFEHFRRFGFAIWSTERMAGYGLFWPVWDSKKNNTENRPYTHHAILNAWRSILGEEELAEGARENQNRIVETGNRLLTTEE